MFEDCLDSAEGPALRGLVFREMWEKASRGTSGVDRFQALRVFMRDFCHEALGRHPLSINGAFALGVINGLRMPEKKAALREVRRWLEENHPVFAKSQTESSPALWDTEMARWAAQPDTVAGMAFDWALWDAIRLDQDRDFLEGPDGFLAFLERTGSQKGWPVERGATFCPFFEAGPEHGLANGSVLFEKTVTDARQKIWELIGWFEKSEVQSSLGNDYVRESIPRAIEGYEGMMSEGLVPEPVASAHAWLWALAHLAPFSEQRWNDALVRLDEALPLTEAVFAKVEAGRQRGNGPVLDRSPLSAEQEKAWFAFAEIATHRHRLEEVLAQPVASSPLRGPGRL
jgi:hypothetical protein